MSAFMFSVTTFLKVSCGSQNLDKISLQLLNKLPLMGYVFIQNILDLLKKPFYLHIRVKQ